MTNPSTLNNEAIRMIQIKDYAEATKLLTKALRTVKLIMSGDAMIEDADHACHGSDTAAFECNFLSSSVESFQKTFQKGGICAGSIFRDPIYITDSLPHVQVEAKCEMFSYVILYNLALCYHLRGMEEEEDHLQQAFLEKAMTLYEHAHHILANQQLEVSLLHTMAIASNLGHIHHSIGDEDRARKCFQHLLSTILYVVDCGEAGKIHGLDGFFRNVMPLLGSSHTAAAA